MQPDETPPDHGRNCTHRRQQLSCKTVVAGEALHFHAVPHRNDDDRVGLRVNFR
ncbi:hypothetical protein Hanom_Chr07g00673501 [Helianthus anomalus]